MKISFDFDSTLDRGDIQQLALGMVNCGHDVHITTTRRDKIEFVKLENEEVFTVAEKVGINFDKITFTNMQDKVHFLEGFDMHFDDDEYEIDLITRSKIKCLGILINYKNYNL